MKGEGHSSAGGLQTPGEGRIPEGEGDPGDGRIPEGEGVLEGHIPGEGRGLEEGHIPEGEGFPGEGGSSYLGVDLEGQRIGRVRVGEGRIPQD